MLVSDDKATNIQAARTAVEQAVKEGAQIISLPGTSISIKLESNWNKRCRSLHRFLFSSPSSHTTTKKQKTKECWNGPYATASFPVFAEPIPPPGSTAPNIDPTTSPSLAMLLDVAKTNNIFLIGGSIPEKTEEGKTYNTCVVVGPNGIILAKHRKVHLFDIDVPGKITFKESDTLTGGDRYEEGREGGRDREPARSSSR